MNNDEIRAAVDTVAASIKDPPGRGTQGDKEAQAALTALAVDFFQNLNVIAHCLDRIATIAERN